MNWISYSLMMFLSSVALYLVVRKSTLLKISTKFLNLAMFGIPFIAFLTIGVFSPSKFSVTWWYALILLVVSIVFAYSGNKASLEAIDVAPNPGFSLVLSKSYVLFTTIVAVLFLNAELTLRKALAIAIIVSFSVLIMVNRKTAKKVKSEKWIALSLAAFFAWGMLSLSSKYLFNRGVEPITFLIYLFGIVTVCIISIDWFRNIFYHV